MDTPQPDRPNLRNVTQPMQALISDMVRVLITFEMELTAYKLVLDGAQDKIIQAGIPWDMASNVRKLLKSPALAVEAEAEYAPFAGLLQKMSPETLETALACIRRRIDRQNSSIPPEPTSGHTPL
jgi:hypothetical protein